jgi:hypothetical protein
MTAMKLFRSVFAALLVSLTVSACADSGASPVGPEESAAFSKGGRGGSVDQPPTETSNLLTPRLVVTVRDQAKRSGILYWEGATPSVRTDVLRNGTRLATVSGSTTGNNLYTDSSRGLKGKVTYKVCYSGTVVCSNSITVNYDIPGRYASECPTTGTATCFVTKE